MKEIIRIVNNTGNLPTDKGPLEIAVMESIKQGKEKILDVPKDFYKGVKYDIEIDITGESVDTRVRSATYFAIMQAIQADPTMTTDPAKKKLLFKFAEDGGVNLNDIFDVESKKVEEMVPAQPGGGGISAPAMGGQVPGNKLATIGQ